MKQVFLTDGRVTLVSDKDYSKLRKMRWRANSRGYVSTHGAGKHSARIDLHRLLKGACKGQYVDHKDGNPLNNVRSNLRICSNQQNAFNSKKRAGGRSAYKGVGWNIKRGKWVSRITHHGKSLHLGYFMSETAAAVAYNKAAKRLFGKFGRLNPVDK